MSYKRLDTHVPEEIPLRDLEANVHSDSDAASVHSDSSQMFDEIDDFNKSRRSSRDQNDFSADPKFHEKKELYFGSTRVSRRSLLSGSAVFFVVWLVGLLVYSHGKHPTIITNRWSSTNIVSLQDRNVSLNSYSAELPNITMAEYRKGTYYPDERMVRWLTKAQRPYASEKSGNTAAGYYLTRDGRGFYVRQAETEYSKVIINDLQFPAYNNFFHVEDILLNPGASVDDLDAWHLLRTDSTPQWRHSAFSLYWLWQPSSGTYKAISPNTKRSESLEKLHYATFSPSGETVVFGHNHDIYMVDLKTLKTTRITSNGSPSVFNGKPDWVYEEEVYPHATMFWWSPDSKHLVFATINDTGVHEYDMDYYVKSTGEVAMSYDVEGGDTVEGVNQYPIKSSIYYPKPGTKNPTLSLSIYDTASGETKSITSLEDEEFGHDFVLYHAQWLDSKTLLLKLSDRTSTILKKKVYVVEDQKVEIVSKTNSTDYNGWIEKQQPVTIVGGDSGTAYVDRVVHDMNVHLAVFDSTRAKEPSRIISKVSRDSAVAYNAIYQELYFVVENAMNREVMCFSFKDNSIKPLTSEEGKFDITFNHDAQFANLRYRGPHEPWQKLMNMADWSENTQFLDEVRPVNNVERLSKALMKVNMPTRVYSQVKVGRLGEDAVLNMIEIIPPNFDPKNKHPLLVHVYGGPGSVNVEKDFTIDFQDIVSTRLNAVVLLIDPRGTGKDDWKLKSWASGQIGHWEADDIISVTKDYIAKNSYIDNKHTAVWGWSYGGFTTLKTLEIDKGRVFKFGMAVAPVTNWLFYDSIYTERYMKSPTNNKNYKETARINDFESFKSTTRFLVMAGTADDNVHLQNILWLLDNFNLHAVENYDMHIFPDSDHSIYYHNANAIVFDKLLNWLTLAFAGMWD